MSIKLLPASANPVDPLDVSTGLVPFTSTSLVPFTQRAIIRQASQISVAPSADTFAWSSSTRQGGANRINGTPLQNSQSDDSERSGWQYLSGWAWSHSVERTAVAHYLFYAAGPSSWSGRLIDLYA